MDTKKNSSLLKNLNYYDLLFKSDLDPTLFIIGHEFVDCNQAALDILKMSSKEQLSHIHPSQISPEYQPDGELSSTKADNKIKTCYDTGFNRFEWVHQNLLNEEFWVEVTLKKLTIEDTDILYVSWRDISKRKKKERKIQNQNFELKNKNNYIEKINTLLVNSGETNEEIIKNIYLLEEYKKALDASSIVSKADPKGVITYVNENFCKISGYSKEELLGQHHSIIRNPMTPKSFFKDMWNTISNKEVFKGVISNRRKDGTIYFVDSTIVPIVNQDGDIVEYIGIRNDISSLYEKDQIIHEHLTDSLTGLSNRQKLLSDLEDVIFPKLALININQFKDINDAYGIKAGDTLLAEFAQRLKEIRNFNISIYRIGGDIFAILGHGNLSLENLELQCQSFLSDLEDKPLRLEDIDIDLSISIGISSAKEWLLPQAEMALMNAKNRNKTIVIFESLEESDSLLDKNLQLTKEIKTAINSDNVLMYGQKIISNTNGEERYEVLMRMKNSHDEILSPYFFLEHAKKAKLYDNMTRSIIKKACDYFKQTNTKFSLNLTLQDITNEQTVNFLINTLKETHTNNQVTLEIVESEGIESFEEVREFIKTVKQIGCKIAIDDFGTGYSNFEYIIKLNVDYIKIDGSLIKNIHNDNNMYLTVRAIVNFAKALNIKVVAEYVHSQKVMNIVKELNIEYSQGFHLHEPEHLIKTVT